MRTFEQWLREAAPANPFPASMQQAQQPNAPQTNAPQPNQPAQQNQQSPQQPTEDVIDPASEQNFIINTKRIPIVSTMNGPFNQIVQTAKHYHNNPTQRDAFLQRMVNGFKDLGDDHQFNAYLNALARGIKNGKGYPNEGVDITQPWNSGWENTFSSDGFEGEHVADKVGNAAQLAIGDLKQLSQFGSQSQRSIFSQS